MSEKSSYGVKGFCKNCEKTVNIWSADGNEIH